MALHRATFLACAVLVMLTPSSAAPRFGPWSAPVNLGAAINSASNDATPAVSKDGSTLYFNSNRPGGSGGADLWLSQWDETARSWAAPVNLGGNVNSSVIDAAPALSRDERWLFFQSNRGGNMDIWVSYRPHVHDDFGWQPPVNLGGGVNSPFEETMGGFFENDDGGPPQIFFASTRRGTFDLYVSELQPDGLFGPPALIMPLSSAVADPGLMISFTGLEAFFFSARISGRRRATACSIRGPRRRTLDRSSTAPESTSGRTSDPIAGRCSSRRIVPAEPEDSICT